MTNRYLEPPAGSDGNPISALALAVGVIWYLVLGTGIVSDDFALIVTLSKLSPEEMLLPTAASIATPLTHFTHAWPYHLIQFHGVIFYDFLKALYVTLAFLMLRSFFGLWLGAGKSIIVAGLFVFYPIHDAVTYWFMGQYLLLSFALYAFAFFLLERGRPVASFVFGLSGSFISYGSTAIACGLALIFVMRKDFRRAALLLAPNLIYAGYYLFVAVHLGKGVNRIPSDLGIAALARQYLLQVATFIDSAIGPSFWLKVFFALGELTLVSAVIGATVWFALSRLRDESGAGAARGELIWGALATTLAAFALFSVTGFYPQIAFNLGDRVTIFGNFLMVALLAALPWNRRLWLAALGLYVAVVFGVSDHWKAWNLHQQAVIERIGVNAGLRQILPGQVLFVTGNQYSRFGRISHLEFFSEAWVVNSVFALALSRPPAYEVTPLNARFHYADGYLVDRKYATKRPVRESIWIYDSEGDRLAELPVAGINAYIERMPRDYRNWVQFLGDGPLKRAILFLMPRLEYAF
ncbi:MAG: hypothetical protein HY525_11570 [Betaproteobacteria bacterium]|nr:hypothetical protein [Betaproteobacteria bacterium]